MRIVENPAEAYEQISQWKHSGKSVGLVPTMGALHAGHLALVQRSRDECDFTAATIFVNPTQFGPQEDLSRYPRTLDADLKGLSELRTDLVFLPTSEQLYPRGYSTYIQPPQVALPLEGVHRPEHFRGVATIVLKLFQILPASVGYFGLKDYQQWMVIKRMVEDLNVSIRIEGCETVRDPDGLAMSSRNRYLNPTERQTALSLSRALRQARKRVAHGNCNISELELAMEEQLKSAGMDRIDYARVVCRETLGTLDVLDRPAVALIAAYVGTTRLIDNVLLDHQDAAG